MLVALEQQWAEIASGVHVDRAEEDIGAGDQVPPTLLPHRTRMQGLMFGYATDETEEAMPLSLLLAHKLMARLHALRRDGTLPWALPDSKSQVVIKPVGQCNIPR